MAGYTRVRLARSTWAGGGAAVWIAVRPRNAFAVAAKGWVPRGHAAFKDSRAKAHSRARIGAAKLVPE